MKLLIDIGNTTTSMGLWKNSKLSMVANSDNNKLFIDIKKYSKKEIDRIILISVISAKDNKLIKDKLKKIFKCEVEQIKSTSKLLGVINGYKQPTKLGDDRWCTIVGAYYLFKKPSTAYMEEIRSFQEHVISQKETKAGSTFKMKKIRLF